MLNKYLRGLFLPTRECSFCANYINISSFPNSEEYILNRIYSITSICSSCKKGLEIPTSPYCLYCHKPLNRNNSYDNRTVCEDCKSIEDRNFIFNRSALLYNSYLKEHIALYKYRGKQSIANEFSYLLKIAYDTYYKNIDIRFLVYIPIHNNRLQERGFNQSRLITERLSDLTGIPLVDCLERTRDTKKQSKQSKTMRFEQIKNSFIVKNDTVSKISNKNILIIDDIYTTGATIAECSRVLKTAGANEIYSLTLSRAYDI